MPWLWVALGLYVLGATLMLMLAAETKFEPWRVWEWVLVGAAWPVLVVLRAMVFVFTLRA